MNEQLYYCIKDPELNLINFDKTFYSSSGSASSDQNTLRTDYSVQEISSCSTPCLFETNTREEKYNTQNKRTLDKYL